MYRVILSVIFSLLATVGLCQRAQRVMIAAHTDLIKSDNDGFFEKAQGGFEGSFYFSRKFAVTTGVEWWSEDAELIIVPGLRLCPVDEAFLRVRGLFGKDISIGGGFAKPLSDRFRIEATGDIYFSGYIAIRAGVAYGFGPRP